MANPADHKLSVADEDHEEVERRGLLQRAQLVRAAILGANDGLSTTSLMLGVGVAKEDLRSMVLSRLAGAIAGACSMAVGEFVSVSTQRDIEKRTHGYQSWKQNVELSRQIGEKNNLQLSHGATVNLSPATGSSVKVTTPARNLQTNAMSPVMRVVTADDANAVKAGQLEA